MGEEGERCHFNFCSLCTWLLTNSMEGPGCHCLTFTSRKDPSQMWNFLPMPTAQEKGPKVCGAPKTRIKQPSLQGESQHGFCKALSQLEKWRHYKLSVELLYQTHLESTCGLDISMWPRPGRSEKVGGARRAQGLPGLAEPWCVCNNKTKDTCLCGWGLCWLVFTREGSVPRGCEVPSHRPALRSISALRP